MVSKGHPLSYFFSLSLVDKMFCHAAMEVEDKREGNMAAMIATGRSVRL